MHTYTPQYAAWLKTLTVGTKVSVVSPRYGSRAHHHRTGVVEKVNKVTFTVRSGGATYTYRIADGQQRGREFGLTWIAPIEDHLMYVAAQEKAARRLDVLTRLVSAAERGDDWGFAVHLEALTQRESSPCNPLL